MEMAASVHAAIVDMYLLSISSFWIVRYLYAADDIHHDKTMLISNTFVAVREKRPKSDGDKRNVSSRRFTIASARFPNTPNK